MASETAKTDHAHSPQPTDHMQERLEMQRGRQAERHLHSLEHTRITYAVKYVPRYPA